MTEHVHETESSSLVGRLTDLLPITRWLRQYEWPWLRWDLFAGITLAAYAIPVALAYAALAGLPPQMGLYCYLVGGLGYVLLGTSRQLAIGPTSALAMLLGVSLAEQAAGDAERLASLASLTAVFMAVVFALAWLLRLSVLVNFISDSILTGFKAGAAISIASTQLPKLFGVPGGGDDFFERLWHLAQQMGTTNPWALGIGLAALVLLLLGDKFLPGRPVALLVVLLSILAVWLAPFEEYGVKIVGDIPAGLPRFQGGNFGFSELTVADARQIARLAFACFLLSYIESISAARSFALKHKYHVNPRQELLGLGAACLLAGLWQGFPVAGGLSQSAVNERGGAKSPLSLVFASAALAVVLLFCTWLFRTLPDAVLAAVVLVAVKGLISLPELGHLWRVSRVDFAAAAVALVGVLLMGILDGVVVAVLVSLVMVLWRNTRPHVATLGRIPGTNRFTDISRHPDNELVPGVFIFRVESSLLYFNVEHVLETVQVRVQGQRGLRSVVCDLSSAPYIDVAGARMLRRLHDELEEHRVRLILTEAHGRARDALRAEGLEEHVGAISRRRSLADVVAEVASAAPS